MSANQPLQSLETNMRHVWIQNQFVVYWVWNEQHNAVHRLPWAEARKRLSYVHCESTAYFFDFRSYMKTFLMYNSLDQLEKHGLDIEPGHHKSSRTLRFAGAWALPVWGFMHYLEFAAKGVSTTYSRRVFKIFQNIQWYLFISNEHVIVPFCVLDLDLVHRSEESWGSDEPRRPAEIAEEWRQDVCSPAKGEDSMK